MVTVLKEEKCLLIYPTVQDVEPPPPVLLAPYKGLLGMRGWELKKKIVGKKTFIIPCRWTGPGTVVPGCAAAPNFYSKLYSLNFTG